MNMNHLNRWKRNAAALLAAILVSASFAAHADEREDLEKLRATVLSLIDALVKNHILPQDKADAMMRDAESRANTKLAQMPPPEVSPDGKKIVRVPYVPDAVKVQMHDQIKAEVLAETRNERMGSFGGADWAGRIQMEGDLRLRAETTRLNNGNTPVTVAAYDMSSNGLTRFPDFLSTGANILGNYNSQESTKRTRLRARLGINATISDAVSAGISLATGNTTVPTSTNQTMGQNFNKEGVYVDRAFIKYAPESWLSMSGGRIRNPYFGTDLLWADDLNFEGFALALKPHLDSMPNTFFTAGWFPLNFGVPNQSTTRDLVAIQGGVDWQLGQKENRVKLGAALYDYHGIEGVAEMSVNNQGAAGIQIPDYGVRSQYNYGQRGNTLFRVTDSNLLAANTYWGLASSFRELNLTGTVDIAQFDPAHVVLTGDLVKNLGFNRNDILKRTGQYVTDGQSLGYMGKVQVGALTMNKRGDWNVALAYRYLGSDAVLDAFTNSDFGLGGTNTKGTILGMNYGLDKNTWLSARWYSSNLIDSMVPTTSTTSSPTKFSVDLLQVDLNTKF